MKHTLAWLLASITLLLTACGQKGPLYMPTQTTVIIDQDDTNTSNPNDY